MTADIAELLPEVRRLIDEGKELQAYELADTEAKKQLVEKGRAYRKGVIPHPAFDLCIERAAPGDPVGYRHQLDLETGESLTRWSVDSGSVEQRAFSSRPHNVNVIHLKGTGGHRLEVGLRLKETPGRSGKVRDIDLKDFIKSVKATVSPGWMTYDADYGLDPGGYQGVARVSVKGGTMTAEGERLRVSGADEVLILIRIVAQQDGSVSQINEMKAELAKIPEDYPRFFKPHATEHGEMFRRVVLDLGAAAHWKSAPTEKQIQIQKEKGATPLFLEQRHAVGRYMLISACGKYPSPLEGIWGASWKPAWDGGFVLDTNANLQISAAAMGNLPECFQSWLGYIKGLLPGWRINARHYTGCRGFLAANYADPETGYLVHIGNNMGWMYWPGGAGWNIHPIYDYALLTGDREFMKKEVLPIYLELSDFYEDYMVLGKDGFYHIYPGVSPENKPRNMKVKPVKDCTHDITVAREVFRILIELGEQFELDEAKIAKWRNFREKLVPYRINEDGALAEWIPKRYKDMYNHRHTSHLLGIYPWWELSWPDADPKLREAAHVALRKRFEFKSKDAHGQMYVSLMATRLKDVGMVRAGLDRMAKEIHYFNNMATSHGRSSRNFILDASLSFPRLLMEMLVFSRPGHIELLPTWPEDYPDGSITGVLVRGGHKLDLTWADGKVVSAILHTGHDDIATISHGDVKKSFEFKAGQNYRFDGQLRMKQTKIIN
jgi:hypothetical protein